MEAEATTRDGKDSCSALLFAPPRVFDSETLSNNRFRHSGLLLELLLGGRGVGGRRERPIRWVIKRRSLHIRYGDRPLEWQNKLGSEGIRSVASADNVQTITQEVHRCGECGLEGGLTLLSQHLGVELTDADVRREGTRQHSGGKRRVLLQCAYHCAMESL